MQGGTWVDNARHDQGRKELENKTRITRCGTRRDTRVGYGCCSEAYSRAEINRGTVELAGNAGYDSERLPMRCSDLVQFLCRFFYLPSGPRLPVRVHLKRCSRDHLRESAASSFILGLRVTQGPLSRTGRLPFLTFVDCDHVMATLTDYFHARPVPGLPHRVTLTDMLTRPGFRVRPAAHLPICSYNWPKFGIRGAVRGRPPWSFPHVRLPTRIPWSIRVAATTRLLGPPAGRGPVGRCQSLLPRHRARAPMPIHPGALPDNCGPGSDLISICRAGSV